MALGLDDVVITYMDGHKKFVQVKHTRANDTLTFGDLVTIDTSNVDANSHISLLGELAKSWNEEHSKYSTTDILLFSNRKKGKTNIISKLSGKRNSIVNIRYYAYEPIDPQKEYLPKDVSRRVDNSVFWNELFNQLRRQLLGKLSKYRVPVINNLLPQEQLRSEFFRIAAEYAQDENSLFIVAIDGIDHAARANVSENTFLSALPNPEYLPENVKIVIAGQPKEDYRNYPEWLFNNEMGYVKEIHVPSILKSDIYSLVENKFPEMDNVFKNQLTNVVCRYADGNTLSAIFAVHEATQCNDIVALEQRLTDRKLSGNIQECAQRKCCSGNYGT